MVCKLSAQMSARLLIIFTGLAFQTACTPSDNTAADSSSAAADTNGTGTDAISTGQDSTATADSAVADANSSPDVPPFQAKCTTDATCKTAQVCEFGVCVSKPSNTEKLNLSNPLQDNQAVADKVQLGCVGETTADLAKGVVGPAKVTMWGRVDRFGSGVVTADVEVAVYELSQFHPEACAGIVNTDAAPDAIENCMIDESKVGKPLAKVIAVLPNVDKPTDAAVVNGWDVASAKKADEQCNTHLDCPLGYECRKDNGAVANICVAQHGVYAIENVPTNTPIVVRVRGLPPNKPSWHDSYLWDYVLLANRTDVKGAGTQPTKYVGTDTYRVNPTIVGEGQWQLVPTTMGFNDITDGNGVIGGRVRDCGVDGGRGGFAIHNARVGLGVSGQGIAYFNDSEDNTVPVKTRGATDLIGRFAAVDVPAGPNRIAAAGWMDSAVVSLGSQDVYVIPNALMIVTLPGHIPTLNK